MIQLRDFSSGHDEEVKLSVNKNINPKKLHIKSYQIFREAGNSDFRSLYPKRSNGYLIY